MATWLVDITAFTEVHFLNDMVFLVSFNAFVRNWTQDLPLLISEGKATFHNLQFPSK